MPVPASKTGQLGGTSVDSMRVCAHYQTGSASATCAAAPCLIEWPLALIACWAVLCVQAEVEALVSMCTADNVDELLAGNPDYVLDAIDNIDTKVGPLPPVR